MAIIRPPADNAGERIDWRALWIWAAGEAKPRNAYLYARKTFILKDAPQSAVLHCSADSRYRLHVNGSYVGQGPVPSTRGSVYYDTYDVAPLLQEGENSIALLIHHLGEGTYSCDPVRAGLICQLEADGEIIGTDETWKLLPAADWTNEGWRISKRLGFQEVYDARLHPGDWQIAEFYEGNWQDAIVVAAANEEPWGWLLPREIPYLIEEEIDPKAVLGSYVCPPLPERVKPSDMASFMAREELTPLPPRAAHNIDGLTKRRRRTPVIHPPRGAGGSIILDFGKEVNGHVELSLSGWGGTVVDIGYAERLEDGRVRPDRARMRYTDRYIMRSGLQTWRSFGQRAFRYMQIDFRESPRAVGIEYVRVIQTTQPAGAGRFECNDKLLNDIWTTGSYTARLTMQEIYLSCPWRERAQWWSDARITSQIAYYTSGDLSLLRQGLRQFAAAQRPDGSIPGICPAAISRVIPDYSAFWILSVWEYYAWTRDREFLAEMYPHVARSIEWFRQFARPDGMLSNVPGEIFIDWAQIEKRGVVTALNCLYYESFHRAGMMAAALEKPEDIAVYEFAASAVRYSINRYLWSQIRGLYVDNRWDSSPDVFSAQSNILAVLFDIPDHYRKAAICRQLLEAEWQAKLETPYFTSYFVEILCRTGFYQEALDMIRKRWGEMLKAGATTFWERFTPEYSLCHVWSTGPTRHLSAEFLGVRPVAAEAKIRIAPQPADLKWAKGLVPTPYGNVEVDWRRENRRFSMQVTIPVGMTAEILAPNGQTAGVWLDGEERTERLIQVGAGKHELRVQYRAEQTREIRTRKKPGPEESTVEVLPQGGLLREERGRRRTRRRVEKPKPAVAEPAAEQKLEKPPVEAEKQLAEPAPAAKTHRGRRRKPTETAAPAAAPATIKASPEPEPVQETPVSEQLSTAELEETSVTAPAVKAAKTRRRTRKPTKPAEVGAEFRAPARDVDSAIEPQPEAGSSSAQKEESEPEAKPKRRPTRRRRPKTVEGEGTGNRE